MSKELINIENNHFVKEQTWVNPNTKEEGTGISLSINKTIIPNEYNTNFDQFKPENSIQDLINHGFIENLTLEIYRIMGDYLALNIKGRSLNTPAGLSIVFEHIIEECSNLELQEINFIFRSGIMGKFGVIYNDISIDTICGKEGWIESYYRDYRKHRIETKTENIIRLTGKEMTMEQFHAKNPEFKIKYDLHGIYDRAKKYQTTIEDAKQFYKIKGLSDGDFKDDFQYFAKEYQNQKLINSEMVYITESFRKFIIQNVFKTKR